MDLQWIRREMENIERTIRDLSKLTTQLLYTQYKYRVKRDLEKNACVTQDDDSAEYKIDCL